MTELSLEQRDRAVGAILGAAVGDALGAPYEFSTSSPGVTLRGTADDFPGGGAHHVRLSLRQHPAEHIRRGCPALRRDTSDWTLDA